MAAYVGALVFKFVLVVFSPVARAARLAACVRSVAVARFKDGRVFPVCVVGSEGELAGTAVPAPCLRSACAAFYPVDARGSRLAIALPFIIEIAVDAVEFKPPSFPAHRRKTSEFHLVPSLRIAVPFAFAVSRRFAVSAR